MKVANIENQALHTSAGATIGDHAYFSGGSAKQGGDAITAQLLVFTMPY